MILQEDHNHVRMSNSTTTTQFVIEASSKAFDVLSNNLYANKILAIVRELSCNAIDSHIEAGTEQTPFDLTLPTESDPRFMLRDYGTGLSDFDIRGGWISLETGEKVPPEQYDADTVPKNELDEPLWELKAGIYNSYFRSTKTASNSTVGQYGLGSKSPFSYTPNFLVESYFNGQKAIYSCFKDERNIPSVALMTVIPTTEQNGIGVSFTVKPSDISNFLAAARRALEHFEPSTYNIIGYHATTISDTHEVLEDHQTWKMLKRATAGVFVVQGRVEYPVDSDSLIAHGLDERASMLGTLTSTAFVSYVPIGTVSPAPSREHLSYDRRTIEALVARLNEIVQQLVAPVEEQLNKCATLVDAQRQLSSMLAASVSLTKIHAARPFSYHGTNITTTALLIEGHKDAENHPFSVTVLDVKSKWKRSRGYSDVIEERPTMIINGKIAPYRPHVSDVGAVEFIVVDNKGTSLKRTLLNYASAAHKKTFVVVRSEQLGFWTSHSNWMSTCFSGRPENFTLYSSLTQYKPSVSKRTTLALSSTVKRSLAVPIPSALSAHHIVVSRTDWARSTFDPSEGGYYVLYQDGFADGKFGQKSPVQMAYFAHRLCPEVDLDEQTIFGLTPKDVKALGAHADKWQRLDLMIEEATDADTSQKLYDEYVRWKANKTIVGSLLWLTPFVREAFTEAAANDLVTYTSQAISQTHDFPSIPLYHELVQAGIITNDNFVWDVVPEEAKTFAEGVRQELSALQFEITVANQHYHLHPHKCTALLTEAIAKLKQLPTKDNQDE